MNAARALTALIALALLSACAPQNAREGGPEGSAARINVDLGKAYIANKDYSQALKKLKRALSQDPEYADAHGTIAVLYWRLGEDRKAERQFERALELDPKNSLIHNSYGAFLCNRKRLDDADRQFHLALSNPLYDHPEVAYTNAGVCMLRKPDKVKAEQYFRAALRHAPQFPPALLNMAVLSFGQKRYQESEGYLKRYQAVGQESAASLWLGIRVERQLGNLDAAASYALRLKSKFPDSEETRLLLEMEKNEQRAGS